MMLKMYKTWINEEDMSKFPSFMQEMDSLLLKYRGDRPFSDEEVEDFANSLDNELEGREDSESDIGTDDSADEEKETEEEEGEEDEAEEVKDKKPKTESSFNPYKVNHKVSKIITANLIRRLGN